MTGNGSNQRDLIKGALLKIEELQAKLRSLEAEKSEPIAIVGLGCRFPGGENPAAFWELLTQGRDAIRDVPADHWDSAAYYDPDPDAPGKMYTQRGGFLDGVQQFDPHFFGIAPREAASMDPQQRLLLEVAWEALEHANIPARNLYGSATGVFIGIIAQDYSQRLLTTHCLDRIDAYAGTGASLGMAAGRLSYCLGLSGPSFTVDTACSSSLVALHLAAASLRRRECDLALTGGVNLMLEPGLSVNFCKARMLAPDGLCKTFDATADGYVRGEGCGVLVLKRLADAVAAGDRILAVVRGSAVNQDGASGGLTIPSGPAQEQVMRLALANAGVTPNAVDYIEAHGTGTALGDPIELGALDQVFSQSRDAAQPLYLGSVKTNIGHLEAAAGVAGIIKLVLALQHEQLPPHLHCSQPTPRFPWDSKPLQVTRNTQAWPRGERPRIAGVSSFGFSGTNAHVLIEEAPLASAPVEHQAALLPLVLSARSAEGLKALAARYRDYLHAHPETHLADLRATAARGRSHLPHRLSVVTDSAAELAADLDAFAHGHTAPHLIAHANEDSGQPAVAFLFTGQGSQYPGMGAGLYRTQPVFRRAIDRCAEILAPLCAVPLTELLFSAQPAERLDQTLYTQPALFCLEYALAELWQAVGIQPAALLGHSVGEYVAACVAGVFSLEDGVRLIAARARLMQSLPEGGAMAAVFAPETRVAQALTGRSQHLAIAAVNAPANVVLSGDASTLAEALAELEAEGLGYRRLKVSHAFHSPLLAPMLGEFATVAASVQYRPPLLPLVSNLTGELAGPDIATPGYWVEHARNTVRYADGLLSLRRQHIGIFLELGPNPVLLGLARQSDGGAILPVASLSQGTPDEERWARAVGELFVHGAAIHWAALYPHGSWRALDLPTYPYQRDRYWIERLETIAKPLPTRTDAHPLLGQRLNLPASPAGEIRYQRDWHSPGFTAEHRVFERSVLPAAAYVEMALGLTQTPTRLEDLSIRQALVFSDNQPCSVQLVANGSAFEIYSLTEPEAAWTLHATGNLARFSDQCMDRLNPSPTLPLSGEGVFSPPDKGGWGVKTALIPDTVTPAQIDLGSLRKLCRDALPVAEFYRDCAAKGLNYGPLFQALRELWRGDREALGRVELAQTLAADVGRYRLHPVALDACFQVVIAALPAERQRETWLPVGIARLNWHRPAGAALWCHVAIRRDDSALWADIVLFDDQGAVLAQVEGLRAKQADPAALLGTAAPTPDVESWLYGIDWQPQSLRYPLENAALLPTPSALADTLHTAMANHIQASRLTECGAGLVALESLCVDYVLTAFRDLGERFQPGQRFTTQGLAEKLDVVDAHRPLLRRMLEILAEAELLRSDNHSWEVLRSVEPRDPARIAPELRTAHPRIAGELDLTHRCGSALAAVLRGTCDPLQDLLFPGGDDTALAALYRDTPGAVAVNATLRLALLSAIDQLPRRRAVRILEIGAGTGGASSALLPYLAGERTDYVFTDISAAFTRQAQDTFAAYPFIHYATLDIEKNPLEQGFAAQDYDIVVASNVLHATEDLSRTLRHVHSLLAPGGLLLLLEGTAPQRWVDLIFGMTSGWWRFNDSAWRPKHPLLSERRWADILESTGFRDAVAVGCEPIHQSLIMARAESIPKRNRGQWLIFGDAGGTGRRLAEHLRQTGAEYTLVLAGRHYERPDENVYRIDPHAAADYQRLFADLGTVPDHCVHLWSLDATLTGDAAPHTHAQPGWESSLWLIRALAGIQGATPPRLSLVTRGAVSVTGEAVPGLAAAPVWGMGKSIALEHPEWRCLRIDLSGASDADDIADLAAELSAEPTTEDQIALRGAARYVPRLARRGGGLVLPASDVYRLPVPANGSLDDLAWEPSPRLAPGPGEVEIRVAAAGLNFKDVLLALHRVPEVGPVLGAECAGEVVGVGAGVEGFMVGDRVLAMAAGSFGRYLTTAVHTVAHVPESMDYAAAATLPIAFLTAAYALEEIARVQPGERVLIHAATGGVGQAAIQLARRAGAEIYATASPGKWPVLRQLGVTRIFNSRSLDFAAEIRRLTDGEGVDVVLNSLSGEFTTRSLELLRPGGRFLEIGITDLRTPEQVAALAPGVSYHPIDLLQIHQEQPECLQALLARLLPAFRSGELSPLPHQVFSVRAVREAFRTMQQARHTGKLVLAFDEPVPPSFQREASYLITGGLGGLGLLVADWMAERGAGHLVLVGRSAPTAEAIAKIAAIRNSGTEVTVCQTDIADAEQTAQLLAAIARDLPPLRGIIHSAGVLDDGVLTEQTPERYAKVLAPKLDGAWHLHRGTLAAKLDFFILFSSATSLLGSVGQSNHVAANAFLDALAQERRALGLPALSIHWGAWSDIGYAARVGADAFLKAQGMDSLTPAQGLAALERVFHWQAPEIGVVPIAWPVYAQRMAASAYFQGFRAELAAATAASPESGGILDLIAATDPDERLALLTRHVAAEVAAVLGFPNPAAVGRKQGFFDLGLDSLTSVELRNRLQKSVGCALPSTLAFDFPNIAALAEYLAGKLAPPEPPTTEPAAPERADIAQLSEEEAEASLLKELEALSDMGISA